ncbi:MAG: DUF4252 domain-containing protein [Bacteroidaceae bacterium]|nr:DUF4252 domain-containing protein [Bacteroidaceae bacterium]
MKQIIIFLFLSALAIGAYAQDAFFEKYDGVDNVSVVFISPNMLNTIKQKKNNNVSKALKNIRILQVEDPKLVPSIKEDALKTFSHKNGYEDLMIVSENGERTIIRQKMLKKDMSIISLICYSNNELEVIAISGQNISLSDIKR